jgi:hypothetical protein
MKPSARSKLLLVALTLSASSAFGDGDIVPDPTSTSSRNVEETLSKGARELWFCDGAVVRPSDVRNFCPLAEDVAARCPGLAKACAKNVASSEPPPPRRTESRSSNSSPSPGLGALSNVLFWGLVAALAAFVIAQIVRGMSFSRRDQHALDEAATPTGTVEVEAPASPTPRISDPERWLLLAEQAAEKGRYAAALRAAYSALMHAFRGRGLIELESGQSNGDVLRAISSEPELAQVFRGVSRELERVEFGGREATRQTFETAYAPVKLSVKRLVATMAALALALLALGCSGEGSHAPRSPAKGPEGYYLLRALLTASGSRVKDRYLPLDQLDHDVERIVVIDPLESEAWGAILHWVSQGGHLVAAGVDDEFFVENTGIETQLASCGPDLQNHPRTLRGLGRARLALDPDEVSEPNIPVVCDQRPYWVDSSYGDGTLSLVAEPSFLQNASLTAADNALFIDEQLNGDGALATEFVGDFTGAAATSPISSLKRSGLLPSVLQLLLLGAFFAWRYGAAFGKRRDPIETSTRRFVEHVRVLGACYERARATRQVLAEYGGWLLERASRRALGGRRGNVAETASVLSLRSGVHEGHAAELVAEVRIAQSAPDQNNPDDLQKVRQIESLVMKMGARS